MKKTPYTSHTGPRDLWAGPVMDAYSLRTSYHVSERSMQASKEGNRPKVLPSYDVYELQQVPAEYDIPKDVVLACTSWQ